MATRATRAVCVRAPDQVLRRDAPGLFRLPRQRRCGHQGRTPRQGRLRRCENVYRRADISRDEVIFGKIHGKHHFLEFLNHGVLIPRCVRRLRALFAFNLASSADERRTHAPLTHGQRHLLLARSAPRGFVTRCQFIIAFAQWLLDASWTPPGHPT